MLTQHSLFILQVTDVVLVAIAVPLQLVNLFVKIEKLSVLIALLHLQTAQLSVLTDLVSQSSIPVRDGLVDTLSDLIDIVHLLFKIIGHAIILVAGLLQSTLKLSNAAFFHSFGLKVIFSLLQIVQPVSSHFQVIIDALQIIKVVNTTAWAGSNVCSSSPVASSSIKTEATG